jgi:hypothetical protein
MPEKDIQPTNVLLLYQGRQERCKQGGLLGVTWDYSIKQMEGRNLSRLSICFIDWLFACSRRA